MSINLIPLSILKMTKAMLARRDLFISLKIITIVIAIGMKLMKIIIIIKMTSNLVHFVKSSSL